MSAIRIFGAVKGAGTQVRETSAGKPIQEGPLGSTVMVGIFRSGPVGEVVEHDGGLGHYRRVRGGLSQDSEAPLCAEHFYDIGRGAGVLHTLRVTDGTEAAAALQLYDRDVELGILERSEAAKLPSVVIDMAAHNGGRWAGRRREKTGDVGTLASVISGTTVIDLGFATDEDGWIGASLSFPEDDSGNSYTVASNTAAGVFTIEGEFSADALAGTSGVYLLELENVHELTAEPEYLAVEVADSTELATAFSLYVHRDGDQVKAWEHYDLDSSGDRYWYDAITAEDADNWELDPTDNFAGDATDTTKRPANYAEIPAPGGVATNVLTLQVVRWSLDDSATSSGFDAYLDTVNDVTWGSSPRAATIVLTFTSAVAYSVAATFTDGETADDLPAGTIDVAYSSPNAWLPGWTITSGATAPQAGDVVTIYARTLPDALADKGAWLYAAATPDDGDTLEAYRIVDNDHESVTLAPSVDLSSSVTAPGAPTATSATAGTYNLAGGETFIFTLGGNPAITLTQTLIGAAITTTALAAELNSQELTRAGAAADKVIEFGVSSSDELTWTALQDYGATASLTYGAGTLNAIVGFTTAAVETGKTPTRVRLQWRQEMGAGYDGIAGIAASDYEDAWNLGASPLNTLATENTGVLRYAMPGITDADAQAAAMLYAYEANGLFYAEIPDTTTTEAAAKAWHEANLAIGPAQDYHACPFPSYGQIRSPYGSGLYTAPLSGLILGLTARRAVEAGGYQDAPAGTTWLLSPYVKAYPADVEGPLNNEALNGYGLIEIRQRGAKFYLFGDRIPGDGARGWLHKRLTLSHIGRTLLTNTEALAFKRINRATFAEVKRLLIGLFAPWWRRGWFSDVAGSDFTDQVGIKVDDSNNPATERAAGNLHAAITFDVVDTAERVVFSIGPAGLTEDQA